MTLLRKLLRMIVPPIVWTTCEAIGNLFSPKKRQVGRQRDANWYDTAFYNSATYKLRYSDTPYYAMWCVIADRLKSLEATRVLDIGCGPGQFASLLLDRGLPHYHGIDFSNAQIQHAQSQCPHFTFSVQDAFDFEFNQVDTETVIICTEVLEHVNDDLELVARFPAGTRVVLSVPNFPSAGHVRHFKNPEAVSERYAHQFDSLEVIDFPVPASDRGVLFLAIGTRTKL